MKKRQIKTLTDISWFDSQSGTVILGLDEKITATLTLEEFSYLFFMIAETRAALINLPIIKSGTVDFEGQSIEELVLVEENEEYN